MFYNQASIWVMDSCLFETESKVANAILLFISFPLCHLIEIGIFLVIFWRKRIPPMSKTFLQHYAKISMVDNHKEDGAEDLIQARKERQNEINPSGMYFIRMS